MNYEELEIKRIEKPPHPKDNIGLQRLNICFAMLMGFMAATPVFLFSVLFTLGITGGILQGLLAIYAYTAVAIDQYEEKMNEEIEKYDKTYGAKNS